jgi:hypothetical protein
MAYFCSLAVDGLLIGVANGEGRLMIGERRLAPTPGRIHAGRPVRDQAADGQ